jgi:hypothetical protein
VLRVQDRQLDVVLSEQIHEHLFAFDLGELAKVPISPKKIESVLDEPALPTRGYLCLQLREIGTALVDDDNLTVDDGLSGDSEGAGNLGETLGPVESVACKDFSCGRYSDGPELGSRRI